MDNRSKGLGAGIMAITAIVSLIIRPELRAFIGSLATGWLFFYAVVTVVVSLYVWDCCQRGKRWFRSLEDRLVVIDQKLTKILDPNTGFQRALDCHKIDVQTRLGFMANNEATIRNGEIQALRKEISLA
jgi:hypothetical protein